MRELSSEYVPNVTGEFKPVDHHTNVSSLGKSGWVEAGSFNRKIKHSIDLYELVIVCICLS